MTKKELGYRLLAYLTLTVIFIAAIFYAVAETPIGVQQATEGTESTINQSQYPPASADAYAGNISQLTLFGRSQTKHWQGYYGEITGMITLDDAQNWTLYQWPDDDPQGEIYAAINGTVDWMSVECFNMSEGVGAGANNVTYWETYHNITFDDVDGIDETFNRTDHTTFDVGDVTVNNCPTTYTYVNDLYQTTNFEEILLQDSSGLLIFSTIIEDDTPGASADIVGFDGATHDFQLLVGEDGTSRVAGVRNQAVTVYYFYVDLQ